MVQLDIPTLMAAESFVAGFAGLVLIYAGRQIRKRALLLWGIGTLFTSAGIATAIMAINRDVPILFVIVNIIFGLSAAFQLLAARVFVERRPLLPVVFAGVPLGVAIVGFSVSQGWAGAQLGVPLTLGAIYAWATAAIFWSDRHEKLHARWPMIGLLGVHGALLGSSGIGFAAGLSQPRFDGPIGSLFGLIHFESIIFAIGTAVFMLALCRERIEFASRLAAHTDGLTGISNRQGFMEDAERLLQRSQRGGLPLAVIMFDLDRFKGINDTYGHRAGDEVIRTFVRVARDAMRPGDVFGRLGGEEFAAAIPGADIDAAFVRADRIRMDFAKVLFEFGEDAMSATVSGGVASDSQASLPSLLAEADEALYRAKGAGRNRIVKSARSARPLLRIA